MDAASPIHVLGDILPAETIERLTGYRQPAKQLAELHRLGFWRARRSRVSGEVILERPHFEAVSAGGTPHKPERRPQPRLPDNGLRWTKPVK